MNDAYELAAAFDDRLLVRPSSDVANLVDLSNAVATIAGVEDTQSTRNSRYFIDIIGPCDHLIFVAIDGMGMNTINAMDQDDFIPRHLEKELSTVFPTSTPVVFTSLATGKWPGEHAIIGWDMYLGSVDFVATIIRFIRRSDERFLGDIGLTSEQVFHSASMTQRFRRNTLIMQPQEISNSVYSNYTSGGRPQIGYDTLDNAVDMITARLTGATGPTYTSLYTDIVDRTSHIYGVGHENVLAVAGEINRHLERLFGELPANSRLVMTADHGLLNATETEIHEIDSTDEMMKFVVGEPWGTGRSMNWSVQPRYFVTFEKEFRTRFGKHFYLITVDEANDLRLYSPNCLSTLTRSRLGTHISISKGADIIWYKVPGLRKKEAHSRVGYHSGLSREEMMVPLVIA